MSGKKVVVSTWRLFDVLVGLIVLNEAVNITKALKRGPHHPRSELTKIKQADPHLTYEEHSIDEDLRKLGLDINLNEMSPEDLTFYYFKLHDNDNNNALDGLEMLQAAMHQDQQHLDGNSATGAINKSRQDGTLDHIIEVIDEFLLIADVNKDGLLHYPEYVKAVTGTFT